MPVLNWARRSRSSLSIGGAFYDEVTGEPRVARIHRISLSERTMRNSRLNGSRRRMAGVATAVFGIGAAAALSLLHTSVPFWDVWQQGFISHASGVLVVAPLIIAL